VKAYLEAFAGILQFVIAILALATAITAWDSRRTLRRHARESERRSRQQSLALLGLTAASYRLKSRANERPGEGKREPRRGSSNKD
jgi:Flp pilus assembly protein TadB